MLVLYECHWHPSYRILVYMHGAITISMFGGLCILFAFITDHTCHCDSHSDARINLLIQCIITSILV